MPRVFLLSPAHAGGKRAELLLREEATFPLATRLRGVQGIALGEAFSFMSGLYFRGKLAYARQFAQPPEGLAGALVITANRGLLPAETPVRPDDLRAREIRLAPDSHEKDVFGADQILVDVDAHAHVFIGGLACGLVVRSGFRHVGLGNGNLLGAKAKRRQANS